MIISIIVAAGINNEIGKGNDLLWRLPEDMKRFREMTTGHVIVMGRKTFDSLPKGALPHRTNVVITRDKDLQIENCVVLHSLDEVFVKFHQEDEIFIIGGASIYEQTLLFADKLYLTRVQSVFPDADTFFPEINPAEWQAVDRDTHPADEKNPYACTFYEYKRKV